MHSSNTEYSSVAPILTNEQRFFNSIYSEQSQSYKEVNAERIRYIPNKKNIQMKCLKVKVKDLNKHALEINLIPLNETHHLN